MQINGLRQFIVGLGISLVLLGCGGGGGSGDDGAPVNSVEPPINTNTGANNAPAELTPVGQASIDATAAGIEAKLMEAEANKLLNAPNVGASTDSNGSSTSSTQYHLADVIFTLGTDDLGDTNPNELKVNAAYNYFKTTVVDAGKLSAEDEAAFRAASIEDFNDDFVAGYYEAAGKVLEISADTGALPAASALALTSLASDGSVVKYSSIAQPKQFFGFIFKIFNPLTYLNIAINIAKTVITAVLAQTFKLLLLSGTLTKFMLRLALKFPILTNIMINVLSSYWGITRQFIPYLKYDKEFGELFMQLAYEQPNMAHFVFQNIDAPLYYGMSVAMTLSQETTERLSIMMNWYAKKYFVFPQPASRYNNFVRLLLNTGLEVEADGTTNHGDGNELANEKLYYALFQSPLATEQFIKAMKQVDPQLLGGLMDHIFLGQQRNPADGSLVVDDGIQGNYNIFAIAQGMLSGINHFGFGPYIQNLIDFAYIIPQDRYLPYAQAFALAGYTYYAQSLPEGSPQPTMLDFLQFLMGAISEQLGQVDPKYTDAAQAFGQLLQSLQPYIDEFIQNGIGNIDSATMQNGGIVPTDVTQISGNINDPVTDPLQQAVQNPPAPSSLIDIINNFPVLWEKDYSEEKYKGESISRTITGETWDKMPQELSEFNWMHIPSSFNFTPSGYFSFIFKTGTVDMYVVTTLNPNSLNLGWGAFEQVYNTGDIAVRYGSGLISLQERTVYKLTIAPGAKLGNLHLLMPWLSGMAFDIRGTQAVEVAPVEPVRPPVTEPINTDGTPAILVEPPVVVDPTPVPDSTPTPDPTPVPTPTPTPDPTPTPVVTSLAQILDTYSVWEKDYSNNFLVYNPWDDGEIWTQMPQWLQNLKWLDIPQNHYFSSSANLNFNATLFSGSVDIYLISTSYNLPWLWDSSDMLAVNTSGSPVKSSDTGSTFYVFKLTVPAGYKFDSIWSKMNDIQGIAFDTSKAIPKVQ